MLTILVYHEQGGLTEVSTVEETQAALAKSGAVLWVDFSARSDTATSILREVFGVHPLAIEDVYKDEHRPKVEDYDQYLYLIVQALAGKPEAWDLERIETTELDIFLGWIGVSPTHTDLQGKHDPCSVSAIAID